VIGNTEHIDLLSAKHYLKEIGQQLTEADKVRLALMLPMSANRRKLVSKNAKTTQGSKEAVEPQLKTQEPPKPFTVEKAESKEPAESRQEPPIKEDSKSEVQGDAQLKAELNKQIASSAVSSYIADEVDKIVPKRDSEALDPLTGNSPINEEIESQAEDNTSGQKPFTSWLKDLGEERKPQSSTTIQNKRKAFDVIDEFISSNPQIVKSSSKENATFFKASEHAKQSILESEALYTETYANILEGQGSLKKAIEVLENLILKFPEKSTYFARRIKAVEKQLNS